MKKLYLALLSGLIVNTAYAIGFDISVGAYRQTPSGELKYKGDVIDVDRELGLRKDTGAFARLKFEPPIFLLPNIYIQHLPTKFDGQRVLTRSIRYGDTTYQVNTDISSSFKINRYDIGLYKNLPIADVLDPEIGINARIIEAEAKVSGTTGSNTVTESKTLNIVVPMLYVGLGVRLPTIPVSARGELRALEVSEIKVKYYDLSAELRVKPVKPVYAGIGYRWENLKHDSNDLYINLKASGPFAVVGFEF